LALIFINFYFYLEERIDGEEKGKDKEGVDEEE
jgi:hypothetical protein